MRPVQTHTRYFWAPRFVATAVVFFPLAIQKIDYRNVFGSGLAVAAYKSSPAYAAFEDIHESFATTATPFPEKLELLSAGKQHSTPPKVQPEIAIRTVALKGLTIKTPSQPQPQAFYVAGQTKFEHLPPAATSQSLTDKAGNLLPLQQRKIVLAQAIKAENWQVPTAADLARKLAEQETHRVPTPRDEKPVEESFGFMSSVNSIEPSPDQMRPLWLNGQVEMTGGLAFVGKETQMVVKRVVGGQTYEKGRIWVSEGRFEIYVKSATGQLVAELVTSEGRVLGRGEMNLVHLRDIPTNDNRIYDIRIALRPTAEGASMRAISGYSHGQQNLPVREARVEIQNYTEPQKVDDEGFVTEPTLSEKSTYVARATAPKHWPSIVVGHADRPQDIRLFSNSLVDALIGLETNGVGEAKIVGKSSIVWGQIRRDGKTAAGVAIQMAGNYQAIYFNEAYLPDPKLNATTANGLFAFINVQRGVQALRVLVDGRTYPAQVFPTEDKHVSYVELDLEDRIVSQFKVVDVLNMAAPVEARIRLVGTEEVVPLKYSGMVEYSNGANPFMVEAEAGVEYEVSRVTLTGKPQNVYIPMIRHDWLTSVFNGQNIMALPGRGIVVGFVDDEDYEIELTGYGPQERMQIVYFDARGTVVPNAKNGKAGGGFAIFNAPIGLQTIYIHPLQSRETFSQIVVAEPEYVHVLTWNK